MSRLRRYALARLIIGSCFLAVLLFPESPSIFDLVGLLGCLLAWAPIYEVTGARRGRCILCIATVAIGLILLTLVHPLVELLVVSALIVAITYYQWKDLRGASDRMLVACFSGCLFAPGVPDRPCSSREPEV